MEEILRHVLQSNNRLRRAVSAIAHGHEECMAFLVAEGLGTPQLPVSLTESILLAEIVAENALALGGGPEETTLLSLLSEALEYGVHLPECEGWASVEDAFGPCTCGWDALHERIGG